MSLTISFNKFPSLSLSLSDSLMLMIPTFYSSCLHFATFKHLKWSQLVADP